MDELTHYLKQTFIRQLRSLDWMDDMTKRRAIEKANYIQYKNGYPQYLFNDTWMQENWGYVSDFYENLYNNKLTVVGNSKTCCPKHNLLTPPL
jgi:predicted metalloendopeptidase